MFDLLGGGSGHEPAHAGFIGDGMLHGAVLGHVFASPSVHAILSTLRVVGGKKGVLCIVKNYTGDRLNFGMALETAKAEGIQGAMLIVEDDCALPPGQGITGGRGIAGTVLVHKLAGALAAEGLDLITLVTRLQQEVLPQLYTLGIALSICHLPASSFATTNEDGNSSSSSTTIDRLASGRSMEIGMGIHGERGRALGELPLYNASKYVARIMVEAILTRLYHQRQQQEHQSQETQEENITSSLTVSNTTQSHLMSTTPHQPIILFINNLGALPSIELGIVTNDIIQLLQNEYHYYCIRVYAGTYMTSLDMNGISLSILPLPTVTSITNETISHWILQALDRPVTAPAWISIPYPTITTPSISRTISIPSPTSIPATATANTIEQSSGSILLVSRTTLVVIQQIVMKIIELEPLLTEYDTICGDGDCGHVMKKGGSKVLELMNTLLLDFPTTTTTLTASSLCEKLAVAISGSMGGTSGALIEICCRAMASYFIASNEVSIVSL
jgi:triose/dihydroxyacetone kinase / FAD-AMP lyase (cyclizing)